MNQQAKKIIASGLVLTAVVLATPANAQQPVGPLAQAQPGAGGVGGAGGAGGAALGGWSPGFYLGLSGGRTTAKGGCDTTALPAGTTITNCDDTATGWKVYGGYQFTRIWGMEMAYIDFGKATASGFVLGVPIAAEAQTKGWQLVATATVPITPQFDAFGKLGVWRSDVDLNVSTAGVVALTSGHSTELAYGLGAKWNFSRNWSARLEWERFNDAGNQNTGRSDLDLISIGVSYKF
jgi:OOP family OmpA-OmpF porin